VCWDTVSPVPTLSIESHARLFHWHLEDCREDGEEECAGMYISEMNRVDENVAKAPSSALEVP